MGKAPNITLTSKYSGRNIFITKTAWRQCGALGSQSFDLQFPRTKNRTESNLLSSEKS
jgi:hypothetical protein